MKNVDAFDSSSINESTKVDSDKDSTMETISNSSKDTVVEEDKESLVDDEETSANDDEKSIQDAEELMEKSDEETLTSAVNIVNTEDSARPVPTKLQCLDSCIGLLRKLRSVNW